MRVVVCALAVVAAACGASRPAIKLAPDANGADKRVPAESVASYIGKTRELSSKATVRPPASGVTTAESVDAELAGARAAALAAPSADTYRRVAAAYARIGIFDQAYDYLGHALRFDDRDAATYEARARLWRDAHRPDIALGDAHRAVYFAPNWATAHNTLGTVFQALGHRAQARREYQAALALDSHAAYALNNMCYGDILDGRIARAKDACARALAVDPELTAARNNLGLAQALAGDPNAARQSFEASANPAGALYNLGIVAMAQHQYQSAVESFEAAQQIRHPFALAAARERQARDQMNEGTK